VSNERMRETSTMITITSVFLGSLIALASAKTHTCSGMIVRSSKSDAPEGFVRHGAAPAEMSIPFRIALLQSDMAGLEKALYDVSTPSSPNYGKHLSKEQVCINIFIYIHFFVYFVMAHVTYRVM